MMKTAEQTAWIVCSQQLPPDDEVVETKIDDHGGCRNEEYLKRRNRLWLYPNGSMYVYYTPTHWRRSPAKQGHSHANHRG